VKPILITGHLGLVGRALCAAMVDDGMDLIGFDLASKVDSERGDVRVAEQVERAIERCSAVVHLAAISRVEQAERDGEAAERTNVLGTANVARAAAQRRIPMVHASSRLVYGAVTPELLRVHQRRALPEDKRRRLKPGRGLSRLRVSEDAPLVACNVYSATKIAAEEAVRASGCRASVVRLSNVYGSAKDHPDRVVPAFVAAAVVGGELVVRGPDCRFDFVHVDDAARALLLATRAVLGGAAWRPMNVVTGRATSLRALAELCVRVAGGGRIVERDPRPGDATWFCGCPKLALEQACFETEVALEHGVVRMTRAVREQMGRARA